jgi:hypothetical protein
MKILAIALVLISSQAFAESPYLVSPDGKFLGNLNSNRYDPNSVSNPYGRYGSKYSPDSINNSYGVYGSPYSNKSPNNRFATEAPKIYVPRY